MSRPKYIEFTMIELASYAATARLQNTPEWMDGLVDKINIACEAIGDSDRFERRRDGIVKKPQQNHES